MEETSEELVDRAAAARREGRPDDAARLYDEAVRVARAAAAPRELARALRGRGRIDRDGGRSDAALACTEEAVSLLRLHGERLELAHAVRHLGDMHRESGRLDLAEPCLEEALGLFRDHGSAPPLDLANALRPLALLREARAQSEEAARLWREAVELYARAGVEAGVAEGTRHLALLGLEGPEGRPSSRQGSACERSER